MPSLDHAAPEKGAAGKCVQSRPGEMSKRGHIRSPVTKRLALAADHDCVTEDHIDVRMLGEIIPDRRQGTRQQLLVAIEVRADFPGDATQTFVDCVIHPRVGANDEFQPVMRCFRKSCQHPLLEFRDPL